MSVVRVLGNTETVSTANSNVKSAKCVRLVATTSTLVTVYDTVSNTVTGTIVLLPNSETFLEKRGTDVISANASVFACGCGFRN